MVRRLLRNEAMSDDKLDAEIRDLDKQGLESSKGPDVMLDVPEVKVEEIQIEVEDLEAHVSLKAKVGHFVKLDVGADVHLGKLNLTIKGVEARAKLEVRLEKVYAILARTLATLDRNPEILQKALQPIEDAVGQISQTVGKQLGGGNGQSKEK